MKRKGFALVRALLMSSIATAAVIGCERDASHASSASRESTSSPSTQVSEETLQIVFLGDSLTAGYGLSPDEAFPALIGEQLRREGLDVTIVNAGVSGDTTAGGLRRLDWQLSSKPDLIVICLGGNDGLRGLDVRDSESNLRQMIERAKAADVNVLLLGMLIPTNYGPEYRDRFAAMYPRLSKDLNVPAVPFVLEGVGGNAALNQRDGIHPTAEGHRVIASNIADQVRAALPTRADTTPAQPAPSRIPS